jgi:hypothetical protein
MSESNHSDSIFNFYCLKQPYHVKLSYIGLTLLRVVRLTTQPQIGEVRVCFYGEED